MTLRHFFFLVEQWERIVEHIEIKPQTIFGMRES